MMMVTERDEKDWRAYLHLSTGITSSIDTLTSWFSNMRLRIGWMRLRLIGWMIWRIEDDGRIHDLNGFGWCWCWCWCWSEWWWWWWDWSRGVGGGGVEVVMMMIWMKLRIEMVRFLFLVVHLESLVFRNSSWWVLIFEISYLYISFEVLQIWANAVNGSTGQFEMLKYQDWRWWSQRFKWSILHRFSCALLGTLACLGFKALGSPTTIPITGWSLLLITVQYSTMRFWWYQKEANIEVLLYCTWSVKVCEPCEFMNQTYCM